MGSAQRRKYLDSGHRRLGGVTGRSLSMLFSDGAKKGSAAGFLIMGRLATGLVRLLFGQQQRRRASHTQIAQTKTTNRQTILSPNTIPWIKVRRHTDSEQSKGSTGWGKEVEVIMLWTGSLARVGGTDVEAPSVLVSERPMSKKMSSDPKNWKALVLKNNL